MKNILYLTVQYKTDNEFYRSMHFLVLLLVIFSIFLFPLMVFLYKARQSPLMYDEILCLQQINYFIAHPFNFIHYPAVGPMLPGCHIFLAYVSIVLGNQIVYLDTWSIKIINASFTYGLLFVTWSIAWRLSGNAWQTFCLIIPIACSYYVLSSSIWMSTDNGALFFYALLILLLQPYFFKNINTILIMVCVFLMVFWRHIFLPLIGVFWLPILISKNKFNLVSKGTVISLPALILIGIYIIEWGGITPPEAFIRENHVLTFLNLTQILHLLALSGLLGIPYLLIFCFDKEVQFTKQQWLTILVLAIGSAIILWILSPSTYLYDNNGQLSSRWGSIIWKLSAFTSFLSLGQKSFIVGIFAIIGAFIVWSMIFRSIWLQYYPLELVMLFFYSIGYACQMHGWQRYLEGVILVTFAVYGARLKPRFPSISLLGPLLYLFYPIVTFVLRYRILLT